MADDERLDGAAVDRQVSRFFARRTGPGEPAVNYIGCRLPHPVSRAQIVAAVSAVMVQSPRLASVYDEGEWRALHEAPQALAERMVTQNAEPWSELLRHAIDLRRVPAWRVVVGQERLLHLGFHHSLVDGVAMITVLGDVLNALGIQAPGDTVPPPNLAPTDLAWLRSESAHRTMLSQRVPPRAWPEQEMTFEHARMAAAEVKEIVTRLRLYVPRATANDLFMCALHRVIGEKTERDLIAIMSPLDLRGEVREPLRIGNQVTSAFIASERAHRKDDQALLQHIVAQTQSAKQHRREVRMAEAASVRAHEAIAPAAILAFLGEYPQSVIGHLATEITGATMPSLLIECGSVCVNHSDAHLQLTRGTTWGELSVPILPRVLAIVRDYGRA